MQLFTPSPPSQGKGGVLGLPTQSRQCVPRHIAQAHFCLNSRALLHTPGLPSWFQQASTPSDPTVLPKPPCIQSTQGLLGKATFPRLEGFIQTQKAKQNEKRFSLRRIRKNTCGYENNFPDKEFKETIIRILTKLESRIEKFGRTSVKRKNQADLNKICQRNGTVTQKDRLVVINAAENFF